MCSFDLKVSNFNFSHFYATLLSRVTKKMIKVRQIPFLFDLMAMKQKQKQAGAELCQAQAKLGWWVGAGFMENKANSAFRLRLA
jgi:hypothetical protein